MQRMGVSREPGVGHDEVRWHLTLGVGKEAGATDGWEGDLPSRVSSLRTTHLVDGQPVQILRKPEIDHKQLPTGVCLEVQGSGSP